MSAGMPPRADRDLTDPDGVRVPPAPDPAHVVLRGVEMMPRGDGEAAEEPAGGVHPLAGPARYPDVDVDSHGFHLPLGMRLFRASSPGYGRAGRPQGPRRRRPPATLPAGTPAPLSRRGDPVPERPHGVPQRRPGHKVVPPGPGKIPERPAAVELRVVDVEAGLHAVFVPFLRHRHQAGRPAPPSRRGRSRSRPPRGAAFTASRTSRAMASRSCASSIRRVRDVAARLGDATSRPQSVEEGPGGEHARGPCLSGDVDDPEVDLLPAESAPEIQPGTVPGAGDHQQLLRHSPAMAQVGQLGAMFHGRPERIVVVRRVDHHDRQVPVRVHLRPSRPRRKRSRSRKIRTEFPVRTTSGPAFRSATSAARTS